VTLRSNATVHGNLITKQTVSAQNGARVLGTTTEHAALPAPAIVSWDAPVAPQPAQPRTVAPNGQLELPPGAYGAVTVFSRGKLKLRSGNYAFSSLRLEPDAILDVTVPPANGPVALYVDDVRAFRGRVVTSTQSTSESLLLVHKGTSALRLERSADMAIVAPKATVELATGGARYRGSVYAKGIQIEPDVAVTYVPFEYWSWILPPRPVVSCVFSSGRGQWVAAFGYENRPNASVDIPAGPRNFLTPNPGSSFAPITRFLPGKVNEALWVPMPETGVTWTIQGRGVTATVAAQRCTFPSGAASVADSTTTEGRPHPRRSVPSVPAPRKEKLALENASGPGRFLGTRSLGFGVLPVVADPNVAPAVAGIPPVVPDGLFSAPTVPVTLRVETDLIGEGFPEGNDLRGWSQIGDDYRDWQNIATPANNGVYAHTAEITRNAPVHVRFQQIEYNTYSDHESVKADLQVSLTTGAVSGVEESAVVNKTWVFGLPFSIESYNVLNSRNVLGVLGQTFTFPFHGFNTARWSISSPPSPAGNTRVCANWTAYFVDEALPTPGGQLETFRGTPLDGSLRVRGHRASFAGFELAVKGASASLKRSGRLDENGCTLVPTAALVYDDSVMDGSLGGISLHMLIRSDLEVTRGGVVTKFPVTLGSTSGAFTEKVIHLTAFDDNGGWATERGFRVPPAEVVLTQPWRDHGSTVAASLSHAVKRLVDLGVALPAQTFPTVVNAGSNAGTVDFAGKAVADSAVIANTLSIGPAFFPCDPARVGMAECRTACSDDARCAGGQHCAKYSDAADGCEGGSCFCAWADQGTMKFVTAHEFGHLMQNGLTGGGPPSGGSYAFTCQEDLSNPGTCLRTLGKVEQNALVTSPVLLSDPPLMDESCGCQHVNAANALHCLQSIERPGRANKEGFAQFFSSLIWNDTAGDCVFNYYKEFLDPPAASGAAADCRVLNDPEACKTFAMRNGDTATVTLPPVPVSCKAPVRWRNRRECAVDARLEPISKPVMGTEYDWMTFLFAVNADIGLSEVMSLYNHACHPSYDPDPADPNPARQVETLCGRLSPTGDSGKPIAWEDGNIGAVTAGGVTSGGTPHGGILSGAERKWGAGNSKADDLEFLGNEHGVGHRVDPL